MAAVILEALGLARAFGGLRAVDGVDFALRAGEIHALIGPNGAGKTTFVSLLSGRIAPDAGAIRLDGADITRLPAHLRVRRGIAYTFQITSIYPQLTVFDNVALAAQSRGVRDLEAQSVANSVDAFDATARALVERAFGPFKESFDPTPVLDEASGKLTSFGVAVNDDFSAAI